MTIEVNTGDAPMTIKSVAGRVSVEPGRPVSPDLVLSGPPDGVVGLLSGRMDRAAAAQLGVMVDGDSAKLAKLRPRFAARRRRKRG
jgi:hypothetical protein